MAEANLPAKSLQFRANETWAALAVAAVVGLAARLHFGPGPLTAVPIIFVLLLMSPVSDWLAKRMGVDLVTFGDATRNLSTNTTDFSFQLSEPSFLRVLLNHRAQSGL